MSGPDGVNGPNGYVPGDAIIRTMTRLAGRVPLARAAAWGAAAYLAGYLMVYGWLGGRAASMAGEVRATIRYGGASATVSEPTLATLLGDGGGAATTWAGWLFYNAHLVPFSVDVADLPASGSASVPNLVLAADSPLVLLLFAVPPIFLAAAGAMAARGAPGAGGGLLPAGASRGMTIAVGYLPLTVAGSLVFVVSPDIWRRGAVAPDILTSVLVMGLLYPLVFGALGGWLGAQTAGAEPVADDVPGPDGEERRVDRAAGDSP